MWYEAGMSQEQAIGVARELLQRFERWRSRRGSAPEIVPYLPDLLEMLGLLLKESPVLFDEQGRRIAGELDRPHSTISVSEELGGRAKRFTIAHELGHLLLHRGLVHHRDLPGAMGNRQSGVEAEANQFAAELLMPEEPFRRACFELQINPLVLGALNEDQIYRLGPLGNHRPITSEEIERGGLDFLAELAATCAFPDAGSLSLHDRFQVTKAAAAARLKDLRLVVAGGRKRAAPAIAPVIAPEPILRSIPPPAQCAPRPLKTVVLLGDYPQHWKNHLQLRRLRWTMIDDDAPDAVEKLRSDPPCGVVVDSSFWKQLPSDRRETAVRCLAELSSFSLVRIDVTGVADLVDRVFAETAGVAASETTGAFRRAENSHLDEADFLALARVLELRERARCVAVRSECQVDRPTTDLLKLVAAERYREETAPVLDVQALSSGHSGSRNFVLSGCIKDAPIFAKTNDPRTLAAELRRTRECQPYLPSLSIPEFRSNGGAGALLQPFVSARGTSTMPALSLEEFLRNGTPASRTLFVESILPEVLGAFTALARSRVDCPPRHLDAIIRAYEASKKTGLRWMDGPLSTLAIDRIAQHALSTLKQCSRAAMVHGDAHLRNILLKDGRHPVIVDFAQAGPGHPLFDLARLELGIWQALLEEALGAAALIDEFLTDEQVRAVGVSQASATTIARQSSTLVREACRTASRDIEGWFEQYRCMHALLALLGIHSCPNQHLSFAVFSAYGSLVEQIAS
jgi:hypothetical protein